VSPLERHLTPKEIAELWQLDESTVRRIFIDEPGVLKIGATIGRGRRSYVTLRIPETVLQRFHQERSR
jgi:MarR-like DNA-binding transcriptional regulator SgrR of sgrS sRNA